MSNFDLLFLGFFEDRILLFELFDYPFFQKCFETKSLNSIFKESVGSHVERSVQSEL